jgi:hypothetical protein
VRELRNSYFEIPEGRNHLEKPFMTWGEILSWILIELRCEGFFGE